MNRGIIVATVFLGLGIAHSSLAEDWHAAQDQWFVSPMIGFGIEDQDHQADNGIAASVGLGKQISEDWAIEFSLFGAQHGGYTDFNPYGIGVDFLRSIGDAELVSPYLIFGTGYMRADIVERPGVSGEQDYENLIGTLGLGMIAPLGDSPMRFRGEVRYRKDLHSPSFNDVLIMAGLYKPLGSAGAGKMRSMPDNDSDHDGVTNDVDVCPGTPVGTVVDKYGCERDSDGDGVADSKDRCPGTPAGRKVDLNGCEKSMDSDGDGVADKDDRCPGTPRSAKVDAKGCELDDDKDGVVNSLDSCPNTAKGVRVDVRGCEIREKIELPNVRFELNSATLIAETTAILDQAAATLRKNPDLKVEAAGYTDTTGADDYNLSLSQKRAESVRQYLISKGANGNNITARGYGEANPIADNATRPGRQRNRRVDLRVLN